MPDLALGPGDVTPLQDSVQEVAAPHAHGPRDVMPTGTPAFLTAPNDAADGSEAVAPFARLTGEMVTVNIGRFSHREGRYVPEHVEMELLATAGPVLYGERVREARAVDRLLVLSSAGGERLLFAGRGAHTFACGRWPTVEVCPGCGVPVIWNPTRDSYAARGVGPHPCSERCRSRMRRPRLDLTRACAFCGKPFTPSRSDARTCTTRCRVALHRAAAAGSQSVSGGGDDG